MLAERGLLKPEELRAIFAALREVTEGLDPARLVYTGEHEDFFFRLEGELRARLGADLAGAAAQVNSYISRTRAGQGPTGQDQGNVI